MAPVTVQHHWCWIACTGKRAGRQALMPALLKVERAAAGIIPAPRMYTRGSHLTVIPPSDALMDTACSAAVLACMRLHGVALLPGLVDRAQLDALQSEATALMEAAETRDAAAGVPGGGCALTRRWVLQREGWLPGATQRVPGMASQRSARAPVPAQRLRAAGAARSASGIPGAAMWASILCGALGLALQRGRRPLPEGCGATPRTDVRSA